MKILVPHDKSSVSEKALRKAILFAKKLNYEILLLHIIDLKILQSDSILKYINEKAALAKAKTQILKYSYRALLHYPNQMNISISGYF
ncbi:MAG TPA: universal stress protein [Nitrososphaeraceae archaeon]|nr:universal stress protein [Nitrososphaeraceae archaeon]